MDRLWTLRADQPTGGRDSPSLSRRIFVSVTELIGFGLIGAAYTNSRPLPR
jgi:hypothetical protein